MSSLVIKVGSLVIKTLSKPIANRIKAQAREHETFRRGCVVVAQGIHRWDMRFRIGLLQDTKEIEKQIAKDAKEAADAKKPPTVKTEAETKRDEARAKEPEKDKLTTKRPKIKPLPEAKAIELGANFVSETFLLAVGIALILFENARRGRQEAKKDEGQEREIQELKRLRQSDRQLYRQGFIEIEKKIMSLEAKIGIDPAVIKKFLPKEMGEPEEEEEIGAESRAKGWLSRLPSLFRMKNKEGIQPNEPAVMGISKPEKETKPADPIPSTSASVLSKMLSRPHPWDFNPQTANRSADPSPTNSAKSAERTPVEDSINLSKKQ